MYLYSGTLLEHLKLFKGVFSGRALRPIREFAWLCILVADIVAQKDAYPCVDYRWMSRRRFDEIRWAGLAMVTLALGMSGATLSSNRFEANASVWATFSFGVLGNGFAIFRSRLAAHRL